jgi:hypothetical protein
MVKAIRALTSRHLQKGCNDRIYPFMDPQRREEDSANIKLKTALRDIPRVPTMTST